MKLTLERPHEQYGSAIFVKPTLEVKSMGMTEYNDIEILTIELQSCTITSFYKPPKASFTFREPDNFYAQKVQIVLGDFNCQSITWGYAYTNHTGSELEDWAEAHRLKIIHDPKLRPSFNSARWRKGYNPDNIFISEAVAASTVKVVEDPIPRSQHSPITCEVRALIVPETVPFQRRFNFKKARWNSFTDELDRALVQLEPIPANYEEFVAIVQQVSRRHIPRGCRTPFIPGLKDDMLALLEEYQTNYEEDPFSTDTIAAGELLLSSLAEGRRDRWTRLVQTMDMKRNSRRAWKLIKNLSNDHTTVPARVTQVTANQIAHQLLLNGKSKQTKSTTKLSRLPEENNMLGNPFTTVELESAINLLKENKAAGPDNIRTEQIKHFGPRTIHWVVELLNECRESLHIPKIWRKAQVVALLKPGKEPTDPKNFRPVSLLCHLYKVLERMILDRIKIYIDKKLIPEQAGFRSGKDCCGQILNLTQHIEDGFEKNLVTGAAFVDLSAAYDTVNHRKLLSKLYQLTQDFQLTNLIKSLLQNRRFYVTLNGKNSRWRDQKNGLPQGSVLSPILYNIYTNDLPIKPDTRWFIYADDTAICAQGKNFEEVETKLERSLDSLSTYYEANQLKPNPAKTQVCAFHLRNRQARRQLKVVWRGVRLEHCHNPKYLGVKLDRTLSFKLHCRELKGKISARNSILRKLTGSTWGAHPEVLRTSALALCFAAGEYAAPVWEASAYAKEVDVSLNESARIITGCLRPTPVFKIYPLAGIAPPRIRRQVASARERSKQMTDERHPLFGHIDIVPRLKSRQSFVKRTSPLDTNPADQRLRLWRDAVPPGHLPEVTERLAQGHDLPFDVWKSLNRLRVGVSRCKRNLVRWGYTANDLCDCGEVQTEEHLFHCRNLADECSFDDLLSLSAKALRVAEYWKEKI